MLNKLIVQILATLALVGCGADQKAAPCQKSEAEPMTCLSPEGQLPVKVLTADEVNEILGAIEVDETFASLSSEAQDLINNRGDCVKNLGDDELWLKCTIKEEGAYNWEILFEGADRKVTMIQNHGATNG